MVYDTYSTFGFKNIAVKLSTRPEKRIGSDEMWDRAEEALSEALKHNNIWNLTCNRVKVPSTVRRSNLLCMIVWIARGNVVLCSSTLHYLVD